MSLQRPLRGHCACGRNQYCIRAPAPQGANEVAQVLFSTSASHRIAQANPLSAHIRVPLTWFHSATFSRYSDETATQIRRVYEDPFESHARRTFCGVCGTPLTYWSEHPRAEADYIQVTMGSLRHEDLSDLEDLGLVTESPTEAPRFELPAIAGREAVGPSGMTLDDPSVVVASTALRPPDTHRETTGIPWFDSIIEGSSLGGRLRTTRGTRQSADGLTRVEFEITEFNDEGGGSGDGGENTEARGPSNNNGKRKLGDREDVGEMEGVSHS